MKAIKTILSRFTIIKLLFAYLWKKRLFILATTLFFLIVFGVIFIFLSSQVAPTPFLYTLF